MDKPIRGCTMNTVHEEEADLKGECKGLDSTLHSFEFDSLTGSPPSGWTSAGHPSHPSFPPPPKFTSRHGNRMKMGKKWKEMRKRLKKRKKRPARGLSPVNTDEAGVERPRPPRCPSPPQLGPSLSHCLKHQGGCAQETGQQMQPVWACNHPYRKHEDAHKESSVFQLTSASGIASSIQDTVLQNHCEFASIHEGSIWGCTWKDSKKRLKERGRDSPRCPNLGLPSHSSSMGQASLPQVSGRLWTGISRIILFRWEGLIFLTDQHGHILLGAIVSNMCSTTTRTFAKLLLTKLRRSWVWESEMALCERGGGNWAREERQINKLFRQTGIKQRSWGKQQMMMSC